MSHRCSGLPNAWRSRTAETSNRWQGSCNPSQTSFLSVSGQYSIKLLELSLKIAHLRLLNSELTFRGTAFDLTLLLLLREHRLTFLQSGEHVLRHLLVGGIPGVSGLLFGVGYLIGKHPSLLLGLGAGAARLFDALRCTVEHTGLRLEAIHRDLHALNSSRGALQIAAQLPHFREQGLRHLGICGRCLSGCDRNRNRGQEDQEMMDRYAHRVASAPIDAGHNVVVPWLFTCTNRDADPGTNRDC